MQAQAGGIDCARAQVRAKKLLQLCLSAFIANRKSPELQQQVDRSSKAAPWPKLLDLVIKLTGEFSHVPHAKCNATYQVMCMSKPLA